jgi:hypothetical protein
VPFLAGLLWHVLIGIALYNLGAAGGWYLHILLPWTAPAIGLGALAIMRSRPMRHVVFALLAYCLAFQGFAVWAQASLFAGCATKGADKYYAFPDRLLCLDRASTVVDRLDVIAYPYLAAAAFLVGLLFLSLLIGPVRQAVRNAADG